MSRNSVISATAAFKAGQSPLAIEACACWNDEMAATAYVRGDEDEAARHWGQANRLRETAHSLAVLQHAAEAA